MKLEIHNSKNKNAADDTMVGKASKRFKNNDGYDEGDWGRADKKFAPGPTYDQEMKGNLIESHADVAKKFGYTPDTSNHLRASAKANYIHKPSGHQLTVHHDGQWELHGIGSVHKHGTGSDSLHQYLKKVHFLQQHESIRTPIKTVLSENGYVRGKGGLYTDEIGSQIKYPLLDGVSYHILESDKIGFDATELSKTLWPILQESIDPVLNGPLLKGILYEAAAFEKLDTTKCDICGGNHPESKHVKPSKMAKHILPK